MADAMSDYLEEATMNAIFRGAAFPSLSSVWVALFTVAPSDSGGGTEVSGTAYARQEVACPAGWTAASAVSGGFRCDNVAAIEFPVAGSSWGTIAAVGIFDADSPGGNLLFYGNVTSPQACGSGSQVKFAIGTLDITLGS